MYVCVYIRAKEDFQHICSFSLMLSKITMEWWFGCICSVRAKEHIITATGFLTTRPLLVPHEIYDKLLSFLCTNFCPHFSFKEGNYFSSCLAEKKSLGTFKWLNFNYGDNEKWTQLSNKSTQPQALCPFYCMMLVFIGSFNQRRVSKELGWIRFHLGIRTHLKSKRNNNLSSEPSTNKVSESSLVAGDLSILR